MLALALMLGLLPTAEATNVADSLTVGIQSGKTSTIRPLLPVERDVMSIYNLVYESLVTIDDDYLPQPQLAESWEMSGGGKTWTFHLRQNVYFSDGTQMTARDVAATINYILTRATDEYTDDPGYYRNLQYFVSSATAASDFTLTVKAKRAYYGLLYAMTFPVLPADQVDQDNPCGTGPYVITTFETGSYLYLQTNDYWWQTAPQVETIMVVCHENPGDVIDSYQYARVDTMFTRSISAAQYKSGTASLALDYRTNQLETVVINQSAAYLDSSLMRQAIRYLIDPDKIASQVYMNMVKRTDTPMISGTWMYDSSISHVTDKELAKQLLAEDGWGDSDEDGVLDRLKSDGSGLQRLHLRLYYYEEPDNDVRAAAANLIADALSEVGFEVSPTAMTMTDMREKLSAGSFDLALVSYAMDVCPDPGFLLSKSNTGNYGRYNSADMNTLCDELRKAATQEDFKNVLYKIQQQFYNDCPFICLFYRAGAVVTRRMYTTVRDVRELELLRGIESFRE